MTHRNLTCPELDERLGDYLEGALDDSSAAAIELHLSGCAPCRALVADFERITRSAAALPELTPSHDLWPAIAQRIQAPVADLRAHASRRRDTVATSSWRRWRTGAMAAGLVGMTAVTTYLVSGRTAAPAVADRAVTDSALVAPPPSLAATAIDTPRASSAPEASLQRTDAGGARAATPVTNAPRLPARETFTSEISTLRGIVSERRDQLDPRTIAILESSISTIDSAIADARRALEADPASRFLSSQLNKALEKKLGLLRTVALLPSRT
jgi:anti-sigma factor RsiW